MFSLRIVTVDSYQSIPIKDYDCFYSEFRSSETYKVPIIRIFGVTPAGMTSFFDSLMIFLLCNYRLLVFPNVCLERQPPYFTTDSLFSEVLFSYFDDYVYENNFCMDVWSLITVQFMIVLIILLKKIKRSSDHGHFKKKKKKNLET